MKPEAQRIAIAEACGWKPDDDGAGINTWDASWVGNKLYGLKPTFGPDGKVRSYTVDCVVPHYLNDLNAMHEAEKVLSEYKLLSYGAELIRICGFDDAGWWWEGISATEAARVACATASQRAEAFLRTLGLWREEA